MVPVGCKKPRSKDGAVQGIRWVSHFKLYRLNSWLINFSVYKQTYHDLMYSKSFGINLNKSLTHKDAIGTMVVSTGTSYPEYIRVITTGGVGGRQETIFQIVADQLWMTTTLLDRVKNGKLVKAIRIFERTQ